MLLSTSLMNVGSVIQKRAVDALPPLEGLRLDRAVRTVLGKPLWLIGWVMTASAMVLNWVALGFADISVIQPLGGVGLVVLAVFSRFYLGERLTSLTLLGMGLVIAGLVVIGVSAGESRAYESAEEAFGSYLGAGALLTLAALVVAVGFGWALASRISSSWAGVLFALVAATCSVLGLTFSKGVFSAFGIEGITTTLSQAPALILLVLMLGFSTLAIMLQQLSFQKGRSVVVTPIFGATSVILPLVTGAFVFGEVLGGATLAAAALIVAGVLCLGASR